MAKGFGWSWSDEFHTRKAACCWNRTKVADWFKEGPVMKYWRDTKKDHLAVQALLRAVQTLDRWSEEKIFGPNGHSMHPGFELELAENTVPFDREDQFPEPPQIRFIAADGLNGPAELLAVALVHAR